MSKSVLTLVIVLIKHDSLGMSIIEIDVINASFNKKYRDKIPSKSRRASAISRKECSFRRIMILLVRMNRVSFLYHREKSVSQACILQFTKQIMKPYRKACAQTLYVCHAAIRTQIIVTNAVAQDRY